MKPEGVALKKVKRPEQSEADKNTNSCYNYPHEGVPGEYRARRPTGSRPVDSR